MRVMRFRALFQERRVSVLARGPPPPHRAQNGGVWSSAGATGLRLHIAPGMARATPRRPYLVMLSTFSSSAAARALEGHRALATLSLAVGRSSSTKRVSTLSRALFTTSSGSSSGAHAAWWDELQRVLARLRAGMYTYRWVLMANLACTLQLFQWAMDDVLWIRFISCLANLCYCACNVNMAAW